MGEKDKAGNAWTYFANPPMVTVTLESK